MPEAHFGVQEMESDAPNRQDMQEVEAFEPL